MRRPHALLMLLALCLYALPALAERRVALVIGNGAYVNAPVLPNPANDARAMIDTLRKLGFEVIEGKGRIADFDRAGMEVLLSDFDARLAGADVALFFYAGHALQFGGRNYLLPVDAQLDSELDLVLRTINLQLVIALMEARVRTRLIFLDACRDNPFARQLSRSLGTRAAELGRGLARIETALDRRFDPRDGTFGTYIAYATKPDRVAQDGNGANSPFTTALLQYIAEPGLELRQMLNRVSRSVVVATRDSPQPQQPWEEGGLIGEFYFRAPSAVPPAAPVVVQPPPVPPPPAREERIFRDTLADGSPGPEMVRLPGGSFMMGSPAGEAERDSAEGPQHRVSVRPFSISRTEVSFADYDRFAKATGRRKPNDAGWGRGQRPVIYVNWNDARAYAVWLSEQTGQHYRLPTEAEWEYAARAGTTTPFWTGDCIDTGRANYDGNYDYAGCGAKPGVYREKTVPVGSLPANAFGLHETAGNVWEWTEDCWHDDYTGAPGDGSAWLGASGGDCARRVPRGGSWIYLPQNLRSATRGRYTANEAYDFVGIRLARTP